MSNSKSVISYGMNIETDVVYLIKLKDSYLTNLISPGSSLTHEILQKLHKILI